MSKLTFYRYFIPTHSHRLEVVLSFLNLVTFTEVDVVPDLSRLFELQERLYPLIYIRFWE